MRLLSSVRPDVPCEPIRALDAIHLATTLAVRNLSPEVQALSFDERVRDNAASLGFALGAGGRPPTVTMAQLPARPETVRQPA